MTADSKASNTVVVFDFDKTLISVDSGTAFVTELVLRSGIRTLLALLAAPLALPLLAPPRTRIFGISVFLWIGTFGSGPGEFAELCRKFADSFRSRKRQWRLLEKTVEALRSHVREGHRVVVVSGSLDALVKPMVKELFEEDVEVIASSVKTFLGGVVGERHCIGKTKIEMMLEAGVPDCDWGFGYSDSALDIPLLRRCKRRFLVNPSQRTLAACREAFGDGFDVIAV